MTDSVKYITFTGTFGPEFIVFSGQNLSHNQAMINNNIKENTVLGAGFCLIDNNELVPYGNSVTLGKKPHPNDKEILNKFLKF